jgi:hypothetical protein
MRSSSTAIFRKLRTCPAAETLLRFARDARAAGPVESVAGHLAACDFCAAEAQLLTFFPAHERETRPAFADIPVHLKLLAESLLALPSQNRARFAESLHEVRRLTLTDA